ncbi:MAG: DUF4783 domain-containing protein [Parafilimonas sp.]
MKKILTILGFLFTLSAFAQNSDAVVNALKEGSAAKFSSYFSSNLDVKLPQKNEMKNISKAEAASAVSDFFSSNSINDFEVSSQRELGGTMYITGKLKGASQNYNITVMLKNKDNDVMIITVRIN